MKNLISQLGFTLIELLVVISVIGVLAVAVLSSINPIEQINKGRDTRTTSDAAQLINATDRYFATQEKYPWNDFTVACGKGGDIVSCPLSAGTNGEQDPISSFPIASGHACLPEPYPGLGFCKLTSGAVGNPGGLWLDALSVTAEVKDAFISRVRTQTTYAIYVYKDVGGNATMYACYRPSSLNGQQKALATCRDPNIAGNWSVAVKKGACPSASHDGAGAGTAGYVQDAGQNELICLP